MTDLDKLIKAVEAGHLPTFPETCRAMGGDNAVDADAAFGGSLDAALRLHEALLPGWAWMMGDKGTVTVIPPERLFAETGAIGPTCRIDGQPPRSWLLAILRAVKAQGERG